MDASISTVRMVKILPYDSYIYTQNGTVDEQHDKAEATLTAAKAGAAAALLL